MDAVDAILPGIRWTLVVTAVSLAIGLVLGAVLAAGLRSTRGPIRIGAKAVVDIIRGVPPIVWLFIIFFGIGNRVPDLPPLSAACAGLGVISAAYLAEIYRGGLLSVAHGQTEAAHALGMSGTDTMVRIVGPQAFRVALPGVTTYALALLKDSSIASTIGVTEILFFANDEAKVPGAGMVPFLLAALLYLLLGAPLAWVSRQLDARLRLRVAR